MKVLCVHGVGKHSPNDLSWQDQWRTAVTAALGPAATVDFCMTDRLFSQNTLTWSETLAAIRQLGGSALGSWLRPRGILDGDNPVGWTAGMVTHWAGTPQLRKKTRDLLQSRINAVQPDIVLAHSLGSLISYDLFSSDPSAISGRVFVSFGSQINNAFVRGTFAHGVRPLSADALWLHLYNSNDWMFTEPFGSDMANINNFRQFFVPFNEGWLGSHTNIQRYLNDPQANRSWPVAKGWLLAPPARKTRSIAKIPEATPPGPSALPPRNKQRALLIGVNKYAGKDIPGLEGCVNDVFLVSAALQENGFGPEEIRVVLDERATAAGIRERLQWLFEDVRDGDVRLLYFSGHGVLLPVYDAEGEPDRLLDALVPHDFDGGVASAITDRDLALYYERLPWKSQLILAFDCCRSPGVARAVTPGVTRQIELPDDIRHRMLQWNAKEQMWELRNFPPLLPDKPSGGGPDWRVAYSGKDNCTERLGRSVVRRALADSKFDKLRKDTKWNGPYLPVIIEACKEEETSAEYLHGQVSYGAFTFAFCQVLRQARVDKRQPSFAQLVKLTLEKIQRMGYPQSPEILGPDDVLKTPIPLVPKPPKRPAKRTKKKMGGG
jgi:hypothetical protein